MIRDCECFPASGAKSLLSRASGERLQERGQNCTDKTDWLNPVLIPAAEPHHRGTVALILFITVVKFTKILVNGVGIMASMPNDVENDCFSVLPVS